MAHVFKNGGKTQCNFITPKGRCNSYALKNDTKCFVHSAKTSKLAAQARAKGGRQAGVGHSHSSAPGSVKTVADVLLLLDYTKDELMVQVNSILRSRALIALSEAYLKCLSVGEIETRLAKLESLTSDSQGETNAKLV